MPNTKSELWWMAYCAAIGHSASADKEDATKERSAVHSGDAVMIADAALEAFAKRWPEIFEGDARLMTERWDRHFLGMALYHSRLSKDPSTKVGAVIVGTDREILSAGFNGFPRGIADTAERLNDRDTKLKLVVHAEMNALLAAARVGVRMKGCTLYLAATDDSGLVWGGPPCTRCTVEIIQVGISHIVSYPVKPVPSRWHEDLKLARTLIEEAGISYREVPVSESNLGQEKP